MNKFNLTIEEQQAYDNAVAKYIKNRKFQEKMRGVDYGFRFDPTLPSEIEVAMGFHGDFNYGTYNVEVAPVFCTVGLINNVLSRVK